MQTIFGFLLALFILVSVHEFGHFLAARLCGVRVLRFCIGLGKPFWSFTDKHGTEFGVAPFPLGGYVKMLDEREVEVPADQRHFSYNSKTVGQRITILAAGPLANFLLALAIFWGLLWVGGTTAIAPVIGSVTPGSLADLAGLESGQEIVAVDGVPTKSRQAVLERLFMRLGETGELELTVQQRDSTLQYELDVPLNRWLSSVEDPNPMEGLGFEFYRPSIVFGKVQANGAAERAGLQDGDVMVALEGEPINDMARWIEVIRSSADQSLMFEVLRDGRSVVVPVTPQLTRLDSGEEVGQIGVQVGYGNWPADMVRRENFGPIAALSRGLQRTADMTQFVLVSLKKLVVGEISTKNLSGPIGIAKVAGDHARAGAIYFIEFLAILSIYLGVLNLLPIPILDGGHIVYAIVEAIKGSPISERVQMWGYSLGLALLAGVMVMAFYNDLLRL